MPAVIADLDVPAHGRGSAGGQSDQHTPLMVRHAL
jgi:hypothetical protein